MHEKKLYVSTNHCEQQLCSNSLAGNPPAPAVTTRLARVNHELVRDLRDCRFTAMRKGFNLYQGTSPAVVVIVAMEWLSGNLSHSVALSTKSCMALLRCRTAG
jgi:hypothetical protein